LMADSSGYAIIANSRGFQKMHDNHKAWLASRKIDPALAEKFGLTTTQRDGGHWLTIPYVWQGEPVNHKYRLTRQKDFRMDQGAPLTLWNADVLSSPEVRGGAAVIVTEGELDGLAAIQSNFKFTVSVPNGAPANVTDEPLEAKRYEWFNRHQSDLDQVREFILATDADPAGYNLAADLASLFGAERCKFIEYPFPCKDLNEVLCEYGEGRVAEVLASAKPYPIKGLYTIDDFPERGEVKSYSTGVKPLVDKLAIVPGTLTVLTGYANMGKSSLMNSIIGHQLRYNFPVCVASFETDVKPILVNGLRCAIMGCAPSDLRNVDTSDADDILRARLRIISQAVDEDAEMTLEDLLDYCRVAVTRDGCKMIVVDPWNEIEHKRRNGENETDYIGRALRAVKRFAKQYDVAFWIVAHPTKPHDGVNKIPGLYDISGSANWANKPEYGLTYHRSNPDGNDAIIRVSKVRMGLPGKKSETSVRYDFRTSEFIEAV
jgi:twinkle protein